MMTRAAPIPQHISQVFEGRDLVVISGANLGDGLDEIAQACAGDVYQLLPDAEPLRLEMQREESGSNAARSDDENRYGMLVAHGSELGAPGDSIRLRARLTLMSGDGDRCELLALDHRPSGSGRATLAPDCAQTRVYILPLSPMAKRTDYTLLAIDDNPEAARLSDIVCVSLARGTRISLSDGRQVAIEALSPGDMVLTRDHGGQPVRWIGRATLRAVGGFAPVVITAGAMGNSGDLIVSQHHRMFLYQRHRSNLVETAELLVQAKHLVDGDQIFLRDGGFVDYFSLVFDRHEIIYAEGIPAESLLVNSATIAQLPEDLAREVRARFPQLSHSQHFGTEANLGMIEAIGREALLGGAPRKS